MFVFVEEAAETVPSADVQVRDRGWVGDLLGERGVVVWHS
jgi:hypothetical protein